MDLFLREGSSIRSREVETAYSGWRACRRTHANGMSLFRSKWQVVVRRWGRLRRLRCSIRAWGSPRLLRGHRACERSFCQICLSTVWIEKGVFSDSQDVLLGDELDLAFNLYARQQLGRLLEVDSDARQASWGDLWKRDTEM